MTSVLKCQRWSDGYGSDGDRTMPKKVIRKRGKRGVYYAACRYRGTLLQDSLETTDEHLALQRLTQLKIQIDKGDYQSWKKTWNETEADYLKEDGRYEYIVRKHLRPFFSGKRIMEITNYNPKTGKSLVSEYFRIKDDLPESSLKKHARVLKWVVQHGDRSFELPAIVYRNKGFYQKRFMSVAELEEIISLLEDQHQSFALVLAYTGLDLGDAVGLRWRDVDLQEKMIRTQRGKTGIKVDLPFTKAVSDVFQDEFQEETDARDHIGIACSMLQFLAMNDCHVLDSCKEVIDDLARTISSRFTSLLHITSDLKVIVTVGEQLQRRMEQHPDASIDWAPFEDMVEAVREEFDSIAKAPTRVLFTHT